MNYTLHCTAVEDSGLGILGSYLLQSLIPAESSSKGDPALGTELPCLLLYTVLAQQVSLGTLVNLARGPEMVQ